MRTLSDLITKLTPYSRYFYIHDSDIGYIVWREATGNNIEILFINTVEPRKGHGLTLYTALAKTLLERNQRPYHSLMSFRLASNEPAKCFYYKLGWTQQTLIGSRSIYGGDGTVLMWIEWEKFLTNLKQLGAKL